jgi:hypothetical protein
MDSEASDNFHFGSLNPFIAPLSHSFDLSIEYTVTTELINVFWEFVVWLFVQFCTLDT